MIRIRFSSGSGWEAALVRWGTFSWASHVGFALDDGLVLDATPQFGVLMRYTTDDASTAYYLPTAPQDKVADAVKWAAGQVGRPYDWTGVTGFALHRNAIPVARNWKDQRSWFCSELVCAAFDVAGIPLLKDDGFWNRITPRDLLLSDRLVRTN